VDSKMKVLAIIPARGGSKRVFNKNIKELFGKPLIAHTIMQAKESRYIDKVVVSTDDPEIKRIAKIYLCDVVDRPKKLATDKTSTELVIKHAIEKAKGYHSVIVLLQCTCPMRTTEDIDKAIEMYKASPKYDSVFSVTRSKAILWRDNGKYGQPITYEEGERPTRSQDIDYFEENGSIYVFGRYGFLEHNLRMYGKKGLYVMPKERSIDIDTKEDFEYLEWKYGNKSEMS
jgi:N-acylneuraminate cytidylyltransferase